MVPGSSMRFPAAGVFKIRISEGALRELVESSNALLSEELMKGSSGFSSGRETKDGDDGALTFEDHPEGIDLPEDRFAGPDAGIGDEPY